MSTILESKKYKKKELHILFNYQSPIKSTGTRKAFERKLSECCKWNIDDCNTTEINVIEVYKQPLETKFEHGNKGNKNAEGWNENSNSKFVGAVLVNKISFFNQLEKKDFLTVKTLSERCGFKTDNLETANSIYTEIRRNIEKLQILNLIKVEKRYTAYTNKNFALISKEEFKVFKEISQKVWNNLRIPQTKKFKSFYQFKSLINDAYVESIFLEELAKETSIEFVFESYKLETIENEENEERLAELADILLDDIPIQEKIYNYIDEKEDYFKSKFKEKQKQEQHKPTGFGNGFIYFTQKMYQEVYAATNNVAVF